MEDEKEVRDLGLLSYLLTIGYKPLRKNTTAVSMGFVFTKNDKLLADCEKFYSGQGMCDAALLLSKYHSLRAMLRELRG
jgi:hypothetical protein